MEWIDTPAKIRAIVERLAVMRNQLGDDLRIAVDFHGRVHRAQVPWLLKELEPHIPFFVEEPFPPEFNHVLGSIRSATTIPLATGERLYTRWDFREILENGWIDVIQPDVSHAGGIWELRKIAALAEVYDVAVAPHCPLGPIALASALQFDFCTPNVLIQETSLGIHYHQTRIEFLDYVKNPEVFDLEDGFIQRNTLPGLGVDINEEVVEEMAKKGHGWKNPLWRNSDGSFTEW
jgi:galactonate dehydratase